MKETHEEKDMKKKTREEEEVSCCFSRFIRAIKAFHPIGSG